MRLAGGTTCSCGEPLVTRSISPENITTVGRERGLVVTETCAAGHVAEFIVGSITMTEQLAAAKQAWFNRGASNQDSIPKGRE